MVDLGNFTIGQSSMNEHEDLLTKATACLELASKIDNPLVRTAVLELVHAAQKAAQAAILQEINGAIGKSTPSS
jgi:hypothetical protein